MFFPSFILTNYIEIQFSYNLGWTFLANVVPTFKNQSRPYIFAQGLAGIILIDGPSLEPNVGPTLRN